MNRPGESLRKGYARRKAERLDGLSRAKAAIEEAARIGRKIRVEDVAWSCARMSRYGFSLAFERRFGVAPGAAYRAARRAGS